MSSSSDDESGSEPEQERGEPEALARAIIKKFPDIATDLEQVTDPNLLVFLA